ncbi:MAG: branched-chain amino acid ABC transporter permease [Candidatus Bathyarchaeia archaeon]
MKNFLSEFLGEKIRKSKNITFVSLVCVLFLVLFPIFVDLERIYFAFFIFFIFIYMAISVSWNIVSGLAGQFSLGHAAFFGLGAYVAAIGFRDGFFSFFDLRAFILSAVISMVIAAGVGYPLLARLRGFYFTLGTLGVSETLRLLFINGGEFTGGAWGIRLRTAFDVGFSMYYYASFFITLITIFLSAILYRSKVGLNLRALRDDETAAESIGINTLNYKVLAFSISAAIPAICGCLFAYYLRYVEPNIVFNANWSLYPALMALLGGLGSLIGAIMGSIIIGAIIQLISLYFPAFHPLISGIMLVAVMVLLPTGVYEKIRKIIRR